LGEKKKIEMDKRALNPFGIVGRRDEKYKKLYKIVEHFFFLS